MIHPLKKISKAWKSQGTLIRGGETLELCLQEWIKFGQVKQGYFKQGKEY